MMSDFFALAMQRKLHHQYLYIHNEVMHCCNMNSIEHPVPPTSTNRMGSIICRTNCHVMGILTNPPLPTNEWHSLLCKGDPDHMGVHTRGVV